MRHIFWLYGVIGLLACNNGDSPAIPDVPAVRPIRPPVSWRALRRIATSVKRTATIRTWCAISP